MHGVIEIYEVQITGTVIQWNLCIMDILGPTKVSRLSRCPDFPGHFI